MRGFVCEGALMLEPPEWSSNQLEEHATSVRNMKGCQERRFPAQSSNNLVEDQLGSGAETEEHSI